MSPPLKILDLCGGTGAWSRPYREAGYQVIKVDLETTGQSVQEFLTFLLSLPTLPNHGILAAPPCTEFSSAGARFWAEKDKDPHLLARAIDNVRTCLSIISLLRPTFWAFENPRGRIRASVPELGPPIMSFDPCDYGDPWTKLTYLWGNFVQPPKTIVPLSHVWGASPIHLEGSGPDQARNRSITPPGFARAFFLANP